MKTLQILVYRVPIQKLDMPFIFLATCSSFQIPYNKTWQLVSSIPITIYENDEEEIYRRVWYIDQLCASMCHKNDANMIYHMTKTLCEDIAKDFPFLPNLMN